jgi:hypothetical protein
MASAPFGTANSQRAKVRPSAEYLASPRPGRVVGAGGRVRESQLPWGFRPAHGSRRAAGERRRPQPITPPEIDPASDMRKPLTKEAPCQPAMHPKRRENENGAESWAMGASAPQAAVAASDDTGRISTSISPFALTLTPASTGSFSRLQHRTATSSPPPL